MVYFDSPQALTSRLLLPGSVPELPCHCHGALPEGVSSLSKDRLPCVPNMQRLLTICTAFPQASLGWRHLAFRAGMLSSAIAFFTSSLKPQAIWLRTHKINPRVFFLGPLAKTTELGRRTDIVLSSQLIYRKLKTVSCKEKSAPSATVCLAWARNCTQTLCQFIRRSCLVAGAFHISQPPAWFFTKIRICIYRVSYHSWILINTV